jgi:hypothetical protein
MGEERVRSEKKRFGVIVSNVENFNLFFFLQTCEKKKKKAAKTLLALFTSH